MIKRREVKSAKSEPTPEEIEAFASGSDSDSTVEQQKAGGKLALDPNAKRDFKAIRVPFNEYEYIKLKEVANKTGRTKLNVLRWGILKLAEENQEET